MPGKCNTCGIDFIADDDSHICDVPICPQCGDEHEKMIRAEIVAMSVEPL